MAEKGTKFSPENARAMKKIALEAFQEQNFQVALDAFNEALTLTLPEMVADTAVIYFNMGMCYQKLKNNNQAKRQFTNALVIMPNYIKPRASRMNILKIEKDYFQALEDAKKIFE